MWKKTKQNKTTKNLTFAHIALVSNTKNNRLLFLRFKVTYYI